ncbi:MAG TPA: aminomethyl-transferring glycine dehydrogenase subunit GcvPB [Actinomycetota bacterium]|nr:aminomethyl-transferring glycine dehydrogenase subunit GcvPB [Actinomycetota bacterium]
MSQNPSPALEEGSIYDLSIAGRRASTIPSKEAGLPSAGDSLPAGMLRADSPHLPEVSELDLVRHYTNLSRKNWSIEVGAYPLGSCTMKYNPKIHEQTAALPGFSRLHPWQPAEQAQGALALIYEMEQLLVEITGMARASFQPAAGAAGELTGLLIMRAYHRAQGSPRDTVLIPDSAHGTNPATVRLAGYKVKQIPTDGRGLVDLEAVRSAMSENVAGLMLTNPNTLGLFEREIEEIAKAVHSKGGLLYYDGANLNAIVGIIRPGDMGFDVVHINMHKTFTTPHGGGGPGSGPVAVSSRLEPFLPGPIPDLDQGTGRYFWDEDRPQSIGRVHGFYGNFGMVVRAYTYLISLGADGLHNLSERAVLNANYLRSRLEDTYQTAHPGLCMHEFVLTARKLRREHGVRAMDIAKRLIDKGFHPPTVYFPLVVEEAMMIEPTETESKQTLDALAQAFLEIAAEAVDDPEVLHNAPVRSPVGRLDEARAVRQLQTRWRPPGTGQ